MADHKGRMPTGCLCSVDFDSARIPNPLIAARGKAGSLADVMTEDQIATLRASIRDVPDFPKPGIVFKDITPMLANPATYSLSMDALVESLGGTQVDKILGIDARGFIFAAAVADRLGAGFVPVRKKGKLPWKTEGISYDLEYGSNEIEIHQDAVAPGERVWLVDDVLATGGTASAACALVQRLGGHLAGTSFLMELSFLNGRALLPTGVPVHSVLIF